MQAPTQHGSVDALQRLLSHPEHAVQIRGQGGKAIAEPWTVKHSNDRIDNRLEEALQAAANRRQT